MLTIKCNFCNNFQVNNYQAVVVTDVLQTYVVFSYMCDDIQWSAVGQNKAAVVGFNANGLFFQNHPLSGFPGVGRGVSCTRQLGRKRKRQADPTNINMELPVDKVLNDSVYTCLKAVDRDDLTTIAVHLMGGFERLSSMLKESYTCPCSLSQVLGDSGRFQRQKNLTHCFVSTVPIEVFIFIDTLSLTQQCCFDLNTG